MKPDWKDAPDKFRWLARDGDGWWRWHELKPIYSQATDRWRSSGCHTLASKETDSDETLEARPEGA